MKKILFAGVALLSLTLSAQEADSTKNWSIEGQNTLMLNQAAFSNWIGGGANNVGWIAATNYNLIYEKGKNLWENTINLAYGQTDTKGLGTRKTQDNISISSNYGRRLSQSWYASAGASLQTQFAEGFNYDKQIKISNLMAPGYVNAGTGFTYRPNENLTVTLRPANARWTFVLDKDLQHKGVYGLRNDGDSSLFQFGFSGTTLYKVKLMDNIFLTNSASVFSNYLDHPERLVLSYTGALNMKINKYISTALTLDLVYDHNMIKRTQMKQTLGVGLAYNIDNGVKRKSKENLDSWKTK